MFWSTLEQVSRLWREFLQVVQRDERPIVELKKAAWAPSKVKVE